MAKAIPIVLGVAAIALTGGAAIPGVAVGLGMTAGMMSAIGVGLSIAGTLAATLLAETPPKPQMQEGDVSIRQAIPPRVRLYGRQRIGGTMLYYDSTNDGDLLNLICHCAHEVAEYEEDWLNDDRVQIDENGNVLDDPWWQEGSFGEEGSSTVVIVHNLGSPDQTIGDLPDPPWTAEHRGRGLCATRVKYSDLKDEDQLKVFPSGPPPYRVVLKGAKIFDPRDVGQTAGIEAGYQWSDNAALVVLDYLTRTESGIPVGFGIPFDRIDLTSFTLAADVSDQLIPIKIEGEVVGVEKRWRSWGAYELTEDRKDVLKDLLDACAGRLIQGGDGRIGLSVGSGRYRAEVLDEWTVPDGIPVSSVTLDEMQLYGWDLTEGRPAIERVNEVRATYVSEAWEWAETEAGIQTDEDGIERNGTESSQIKLRFVPSESQAQRVAREVLRRGNPTWTGTVRTTLAGLDAWGERWITLQISELEIDGIFEITGIRLDRETMMVEIGVASYDAWWDWTAETDEKAPAVPPPLMDDDAEIPVPENVVVTIAHRALNNGTLVAVGIIAWDPPPRSVYVGKARYRPVSPANGPWQPLPVAQDSNQVETFPLEDGIAYEAQVRFIGSRGSGSDWSTPPALFTAIADPVAPSAPVLLSATPAGANVNLSATAANSSNQRLIRFWRDSDATFAGAVDISGAIWTGPNGIATYTDTPGPGAWRYWATAGNWSDVDSAPIGPEAVTITPAAPVIVSPATPYLTSDNTPTYSGTGPNGTTVHLYDGATDVGSIAVVAGAWSITASTLADGTRNVTAEAVAPGPITSVASNVVVTTIDTVVSPPVITTSSPLSTTDTTPDTSGTSEPSASIAMFRGGSTPAGSATADGAGVWTATLSPALAVGSYSITAKQTDLAGNTSGASSALILNVNPLAPAISTSTATIGNTNPVVAGTSTASASIGVYVDGVLNQTVAADGSGAWTATLSGLTAGARSITARQTVAGLTSADSTAITLTVVWYDPDATISIDYPGQRYRLNGSEVDASVSGWGGLFTTLTTPAQIALGLDGQMHYWAANTLPIVTGSSGSLIRQPTRTNRQTNFNVAPVTSVTTNLTISGGAGGTLTAASDSSALTSGIFDASMAAIMTTGNAFKIDSTTAAGDVLVTITGTCGITTNCSFQICMRGDNCSIETSNASPATLATVIGSGSVYQRIAVTFVPAAIGDQIVIRVPTGLVVWFILNSLEQGTGVSGPIVVAGASATRGSPTVRRTLGAEWNATEGYVTSKVQQIANAANAGYIAEVRAADASNLQRLKAASASSFSGTTIVAAVAQAAPTITATAGATHTICYGWKANDYAAAIDGGAASIDTSGSVPTGSPAVLEAMRPDAFEFFGHHMRLNLGVTKPANVTIQAKSGWTTLT